MQGNERVLLERIKELESQGYQFEAAEGSFELLGRRSAPGYKPPFEVLDVVVISERRRGNSMFAEATVKLRVGDEIVHTVAEGDGPVHALDGAFHKALNPHFPLVRDVHLVDYKVRILDPEAATGAKTRVLHRGGARRGALEHDRRVVEHHRGQRHRARRRAGAAAGPRRAAGAVCDYVFQVAALRAPRESGTRVISRRGRREAPRGARASPLDPDGLATAGLAAQDADRRAPDAERRGQRLDHRRVCGAVDGRRGDGDAQPVADLRPDGGA